ncbi:MAG TPA: hypothetical protein VKR62_16520 [Roseiarcus sp.]|nr:hypothetical protein [Roseiarcus sp.]
MAETPKTETEHKAVEKQVVEKFIKERIKDFKEKPEKYEVKEKPEKFEHKEKPEKIEHKEKPEKHEFKEKEIKIELLEKDVLEQFPSDPGGPVEQRLMALEQALNHFIASGQRPDLSRGALAGERETKK